MTLGNIYCKKSDLKLEQEETKLRNKNEQFFSQWASSYDTPLFQFWMKRFQLPASREIDFSSSPVILDISCGTGEFLKVLYQKSQGKSKLNGKPSAKLYGIDLAEGMIKKAKLKLPSSVKLKQADVHHLPFKDNQFDYAITTEAFHHYYGQQKALQEMVRVTKGGGKVIVVDINFFLKPFHWLMQQLEPGCVRVNSRKEMKSLFERAGLTVLKQKRSFMFAVMTVGIKSTG